MTKTKQIDPKKYVQQREYVIKEVLRVIKLKYHLPKDREIISRAANWTATLTVASPQEGNDFIDGLLGFMNWAGFQGTKIHLDEVVDTLMHDLASFVHERHEPWFCPRTSSYQKYLTGASGVEL
jgi:hypothetical protein